MNLKNLLFFSLTCGVFTLAEGNNYYKEPHGLFSTRPDAKKSLYSIKRFGPVGLGFDLIQPAFTIRISNVEEGSPAASSGGLSKGQIVESINGYRLAEIDPRIQLGNILAEAEAEDGLLRFAIHGEPEPVTVKIPILGTYSKTWPLDCSKSDKIVRQVANYLSHPDAQKGLAGIGMLFLLSTGEEKDLEVVRHWAREMKPHRYPWYIGYGGLPLAECYLRTGDPKILENIQALVNNADQTQHNDGWAGRGSALTSYGNGHLNAAGTHVVTFLMLAKECGAEVSERLLLRSLRHFYRYAGRGGNPYGDTRPENGFVDNGKNGKLAFAMAAAAALSPDGEHSLYAKARDICAIQSFYTTSFMLHGHTGGGIGEIWRSAAMSLLHERSPRQYRDFMDNRRWHYDLSRRFDGSFGILGGAGYDKEQWGVAYPLAYTLPRKTLRIAGAPRTKYSKPYQLPKQIWGVEADNVFLSFESVPQKDGSLQDLSLENLAHDSAMQFIRRFHDSKQPTDDEIRKYIHHRDHSIRNIAAFKALGINSGYIGWKSAGGQVRTNLVMEFLQHHDARVRRAMFGALPGKKEVINAEIFDLAAKAVTNPNESWWVQDAALQIIGLGTTEQVLPLVDHLLTFLKHDADWLKNGALTALTPVVADDRCYQRILPAIGELVRNNQRVSITRGLTGAIRAKLKNANSAVQALATQTLKETFTGYAGSKTAPGGLSTTSTFEYHLDGIASSLAEVPGGLDVLYEVARQRQPNEILPYKEYFLGADPSRFGPVLKNAIHPIITEELIPEFVGRNRMRLHQLANAEIQSGYAGGSRDSIDGLVSLYERAGYEDYGWKMFMDLIDSEWSYHSFDPIESEQVPFDQLVTRYRKVTLPPGLEDWFESGHSSRIWKQGHSPFGHYMGKLPDGPIHKCTSGCTGPECYGGTKIQTFWEKEVLLMRGKFEVPPLKDGHRYRLRINDGNHVGSGGGHSVYINGKQLVEAKTCNGRGSGGLPKGAYITKEFLDDFRSGEVTIAAITFLRFNDKYKVKPSSKIPQGKFSLHFEEQKLPPMGDDLVLKSASLVPMLSSEWQDAQDPEDREKSASAQKYRWDGLFLNNPAIAGSWKVIAQVAHVADFDPTKKYRVNRSPFNSMHFMPEGKTDSPVWAWSEDILMDLTRFQALKMTPMHLGGADFLFIEAGGFGTRNKPGWKPQLLVLSR